MFQKYVFEKYVFEHIFSKIFFENLRVRNVRTAVRELLGSASTSGGHKSKYHPLSADVSPAVASAWAAVAWGRGEQVNVTNLHTHGLQVPSRCELHTVTHCSGEAYRAHQKQVYIFFLQHPERRRIGCSQYHVDPYILYYD